MTAQAEYQTDTGTIVIYTLVSARTTNGTVSDCPPIGPGKRTTKASIAGTGAVSATVTMFGNHDNSGTGGVLVATFSLSGTDSDVALGPNPGEEIPEYPFYYETIAGISGTDAAVTFTLSVGGA